MESFRLSTARVGCDFLLKIGILRSKGYNKNVLNLQVCNPTQPPMPRKTLILLSVYEEHTIIKISCFMNFEQFSSSMFRTMYFIIIYL